MLCFIKNNGDIIIFGNNLCRQLGFGNITNSKTLTLLMNDLNVKSIYCMSPFLVIYKNNGDVLTSGFINNKCNSKTLTLLMNDNNINTM